MPISKDFSQRLYPNLRSIAEHFGTPFHLYDEQGIRDTGQQLQQAFAKVKGFREYYAVKALPNPSILRIMADLGFGFDCSSIAELQLVRAEGARGEDIMFTSNNTSPEEFIAAQAQGGCIVNLDDIGLIDKMPQMPELLSFRYNPGPARSGNSFIGVPEEAKYGLTYPQIFAGFAKAQAGGVKRFGLHTMLASNERNADYMVHTTQMLLELAAEVGAALNIEFEFINVGGGLGIPYRPGEAVFDVELLGNETHRLLQEFAAQQGYQPKVYMESGRYITGPHGVLVTEAINRKEIYRSYVGVDACMSALMRPGMYNAYHHIDVLGKTPSADDPVVDVVGSLCENNDKFAIQRALPPIVDGDLLIIQDTGAHGHAMGFNYNGKLRPQELLLKTDGSVERIRRAETLDDYFATLSFAPQGWSAH